MNVPVTTQDMHVYSNFSDGQNTIEENVACAEQIGLTELAFADHVRGDSRWIGAYVAAVRDVGEQTPIILHCAVEAKILDVYGTLDLPRGLTGVDAIYAVCHQVPSPDGPMNPRSTRERIEAGELDPEIILSWIIEGTAAALHRHENVVLAHLFNALPTLGLKEEDVSPELVDSLAIEAAESGARIVIDESWGCPTASTLRPFLRRGVPLLLGTGSRHCETIGRYKHSAGIMSELGEPELAWAA